MWHGMFLFLLGLFTGFAETHFANVRMGLAAHLEGVMNGIFLLALGAAWNELRLGPAPKSATFWLALYGTYMNWFFVVLAAAFGTGALSPDHRPRPQRTPVARKTRHRRLHERRPRHRRLHSAPALGLPREGFDLGRAVK